MVPYSDCMFATYGYYQVTTDAMLALMDLFPCRGRITNRRPQHVAMNVAVTHFLELADKKYLILASSDLVMGKSQLDAMLVAAEKHDIVGTTIMKSPGHPVHPDGTMSEGCLVLGRKVLESRPQGRWFFTPPLKDDDVLGELECDCNWFKRWTQEAGFTSVKVGRVGHLTLTTI